LTQKLQHVLSLKLVMLREIQKIERKQRILSAARRLIRTEGYTRMSMRELAREAQVSLVTPYNLFGSGYCY